MNSMGWTKKKPTAVGWYWFKDNGSGVATMEFVDESDLACANDDFCPHCRARAYSCLHYPGLWAGPIPEPGDTEE